MSFIIESRKRIKLLISAGISLVVGLILVLIGVKVAGSLIDQNFAKRWIKDDSYAQVTAFFSELADFNDKSARELEYKISNKLTEESFAPENLAVTMLKTALNKVSSLTLYLLQISLINCFFKLCSYW